MNRTLGSLIQAMNQQCHDTGVRFVVITMPVKAALCPDSNPETAVSGMGYPEEISTVKAICKAQNIPMFDCEQSARTLSLPQRENFFI